MAHVLVAAVQSRAFLSDVWVVERQSWLTGQGFASIHLFISCGCPPAEGMLN
jgi:hypothetical protein